MALLGASLTWTQAGDVTFDGIQRPNNGLLVVIVALFAMGWTRPLARGSSIGAIGVSGAGLVIAWTGIESWTDNRAVLDAGAGIVLAAMAVAVVGARALRIP